VFFSLQVPTLKSVNLKHPVNRLLSFVSKAEHVHFSMPSSFLIVYSCVVCSSPQAGIGHWPILACLIILALFSP
jgi:hypothetical protein